MREYHKKTDSTFAGKGSRRKGSVMVSAIIFTFVVAVASASYLKLALFEYQSAARASLYASSLNLAETGVEMGVHALNSGQVNGAVWKTQAAGYLVDGAYSGDISLAIVRTAGATPVIFAEGLINGHPSGAIRKHIRAELSSGFRPFEKGFSARNGISFSGNNVLLDSYNSNYGAYDALLGIEAPFGYGVGGRNKNDDIFVAGDRIDAVGETAVNQGNASIFGYVTVGPDSIASIGPNGVVTTYGDGNHDTTRVLSDFYADFPEEPHPSGTYDTTYGSITGSTSVVGSSNPDAPRYYAVDSISLGGNNGLSISGHVVFVMSGDIDVKGNGSIEIGTDSSLQLYTANDINIAGNGVTNATGSPSNFYIYGTASTTTNGSGVVEAGQSIKVSGNGQLHSSVYAPAADVRLNGGGSSGAVFGGVVAFTASIVGNSSFHFDEALRDEVRGGGTYSIISWLEMTGDTTASTPVELSAL